MYTFLPSFFRPNRKPIYFVFSEKHKFSGSTIMRGQQLVDITKRALPKENIYYAPETVSYKNSKLFLTKWAIAVLSPEKLESLKKQNNLLIFDPVDLPNVPHKMIFADIIVAASNTARDDFVNKYPSKRVVEIDHHTDPRLKLYEYSRRPLKVLKTGYFGELFNTVVTTKIKEKVDFINVDTARQNEDWLKRIYNYNLHYAVRNNDNVSHKPFLKGFTAACVGANILIQRNQQEAVHWLGKDYPFLIDGPLVDEKSILDALEYARLKFGKKEWDLGLEIMRGLAQKVSTKNIEEQLVELFSQRKIPAK